MYKIMIVFFAFFSSSLYADTVLVNGKKYEIVEGDNIYAQYGVPEQNALYEGMKLKGKNDFSISVVSGYLFVSKDGDRYNNIERNHKGLKLVDSRTELVIFKVDKNTNIGKLVSDLIEDGHKVSIEILNSENYSKPK